MVDYKKVDYKKAVDRLLGLTDLERVSGQATHARRYDLGRMHALLERLGNPHLDIPTVHIAGTKGKGSTAAMVSSVLSAQGYRPGLFISPHLHSFRERIQLLNQPINEGEFASLVEGLWPVVEEMNQEETHGQVTTFELLTAMAFVHFKQQDAGVQVIEVGLGGRLDSTNLVQPRVCVLTSISLDHTGILGDTLEKIAYEKSGIIKPGATAVVSPQTPEVTRVIEQACQERKVPLVSVERECSWSKGESSLEGQGFHLSSPWGRFHLWIPLLGRYQMENAATALAALQVLDQKGFTISGEALSQGFQSVRWPGRLEVLKRTPPLVVDGAHNPYSAGRLREALHEYLRFQRLICIVGVLADKQLQGIAQELAKAASLVIATRSRHPRSATPSEVARAFHPLGVEVLEADGVEQALGFAMNQASEEDLVVVTGSLFVAAEAREALLGIPPEVYPSLLPGDTAPVHQPI